MSNPQGGYFCNNSYGPYGWDVTAALRIKNRASFIYRNTLGAGAGTTVTWQTESTDKVFRGRPAGSADSFGSYDDDKYSENDLRNSVVYRSQGGIGTQSAVRSDFLVGTNYQKPGFVVAGNFDASGSDGLASFVAGQWRISQTYGGAPGAIFWFGDVGDYPLMGDWDGNGTDTVGVFRPSTGQWFFRNSNSNGPVDIGPFYFGNPNDLPVTGNWDTSDAAHEIGVVRGRTWYLRSDLSQDPTNMQFNFPAEGSVSGLQPLLGDWDGDGDETPGYHR